MLHPIKCIFEIYEDMVQILMNLFSPIFCFNLQNERENRMASYYSGDPIAQNHRVADIAAYNAEKPRQKYRLGMVSNRVLLCVWEGIGEERGGRGGKRAGVRRVGGRGVEREKHKLDILDPNLALYYCNGSTKPIQLSPTPETNESININNKNNLLQNYPFLPTFYSCIAKIYVKQKGQL